MLKVKKMIIFLFGFSVMGYSQEKNVISLSLRQCVQMAVEENINMKTARMDAEKNLHRKAEAISALIPKVSMGGSFQDNFRLQVVPLSLDMEGMQMNGEVKLGRKFSTSAAVTLNWALYNQTALTAVQLVKKVTELHDLGIEKAGEVLSAEVAKLYFLAVTTAQQKELIEENIARIKKAGDITKTLVDNGMARQSDYDRVCVNLENMYTQLSNVETGLEQQHSMIKYMLNIPLSTTLVLTDTSEMQLLNQAPVTPSDYFNHIDVRLLASQQEMNIINQRMIKSGYSPSLFLMGQFAVQGTRTEFNNYFNSSLENKWYNSSYIGIGFSIPVFDGFEKRSKSRQANMEILKTEALIVDKQERFTADFQTAFNHYRNNMENLERQKQNIELAEKVYDETALKYREGMATMTDLLQDEMGLNNAQANYLNALYKFKEAELEIMSLNGEIKNLIHNL